MASIGKQAELQRYKSLVFATLNYLLNEFTGTIIYDDFDPIKYHYEQQRIHAEKYYNLRRLDRLKQQLRRLTQGLKSKADLMFESYLKKNTGYDFELFAEERSKVDDVLAKGKIDTEKESQALHVMSQVYQKTINNSEKEKVLKSLLIEFYQRKNELTKPSNNRKEHTKVVKIAEKDGIITERVTILTGPEPVHFKERESIAPDGKRHLRITEWSDGKHHSTYVTIFFDKANGSIYGAKGIYPDINAFWKDNNIIVIETNKDYESDHRVKKVQSFDDVILVEYIEK